MLLEKKRINRQFLGINLPKQNNSAERTNKIIFKTARIVKRFRFYENILVRESYNSDIFKKQYIQKEIKLFF